MILGSVADLSDGLIDAVLDRAAALADGAAARQAPRGSVLGLLFLDTSLRTRVGFSAAAGRMSMSVVEVGATRANERSAPESLEHTARVLAGYADAVVARLPVPLSQLAYSGSVPLINGGDAGPLAEHPTQALIDLFAMERQTERPVAELSIAMCGDLTMRAARSLLAMLGRRPPRELLLVTDPALGEPALPDSLRAITRETSLLEIGGVDVLYVVGIPHLALPLSDRERLVVTSDVLARLDDDAIVLSPMPVIDEISSAAMHDPRARFLQQSDDAAAVRTAVLEAALKDA